MSFLPYDVEAIQLSLHNSRNSLNRDLNSLSTSVTAIVIQGHQVEKKLRQLQTKEEQLKKKEANIIERGRVRSVQIEERFRQLQIKEAELIQREADIIERGRAIDERSVRLDEHEKILYELQQNIAEREQEREQKIVEREQKSEQKIAEREQKSEQKIAEREQKIAERERKWKEMQAKLEESTSKVHELVELSVGGQRFDVPKSTLLKFKGSYFESMLTTEHQQLYNGKFYIDYNYKHFHLILEYMRTGKTSKSFIKHQEELKIDFSFFKIPFPSRPPSPIYNWFPKREFNLLYKATRDGFGMEEFHQCCDNKGPTISIIESDKGFRFGGYSPVSWGEPDYTHGIIRDPVNPEFFLFTITNPHDIPPTRYKLKDAFDTNALRSRRFHVAFGNGCDLRVADNDANNKAKSYSWFGNLKGSYIDTTGKGSETFAGSWEFCIKEVEVFRVL